MIRLKHWLLVPAISACLTAAAYSADYAINAVISPTEESNIASGQAGTYEVDFYLTTSGFNAAAFQRGFANMDFHIDMDGLQQSASNPGWHANNPDVGLPGGPVPSVTTLFLLNADIGIDSTDLHFILVSIPIIPTVMPDDPRPLVGQSPTLLGSVFVDWNGVDQASLTVTPLQASYACSANGKFVLDDSAALNGDSLNFGSFGPSLAGVTPIPEPSSGVLLLAAIPLLLFMSRKASTSRS